MRTHKLLSLIAGACVLGAAGVAGADENPRSILPKVGMGASVGGGVVGFTGKDMRNVTDVGGSWTARLIVGTQIPIGFEAAYLGTAQNIQTLTQGSALLANGFEGNLRLNILTGMWQPYVFAGIAYKHYSIVNPDRQLSSAAEDDDVGEVPVGAGLAFRYNQFLADARIDVRPAFESDLIAGLDTASLTNWNLNARVGFEF